MKTNASAMHVQKVRSPGLGAAAHESTMSFQLMDVDPVLYRFHVDFACYLRMVLNPVAQ